MKRFIFLAAVFAALLVSCADSYKDVDQSLLSTLPNLTASFDEDTRTYVEDSKYLRWHADDRLSVFYGNTANCQYKFNGQTGDNAGSFSHIASGDLITGNDIDRIYAIYPYDSSATITDQGVISYSLPTVQSYASDSFGPDANSMVAVTGGTTDTFLAFKNLCGYLKVKLYGDIVVKKIELKGNAGEKIAGAATITATYGDYPVVTMTDDATQTITLDCGQGVEIGSSQSTATTFWLVVPPTVFSNGIILTITDTKGNEYVKSTGKSVTVGRNVIQPMAAFGVYDVKSSVDVVRQAIDPIFDKCTSVAEFKTYIDQIAEIDGVAEVGSNESVVYAILDNGFTLAWGEKPEWPAPTDYMSETFTQAEAMLKVQQNSSSHDFLGQNLASNKKLKVGILNQTSNDNADQHPEMRERFAQMERDFENAGFEVYIVNHEQLSWEFYRTHFFNFDVILWHAHGIEVPFTSHSWFMCKAVEDTAWWADINPINYFEGIGYYRYEGQAYQMISDDFLRRSPHKFSRGSIIFAAVCGSLKNDEKIIADVLINQKGASTYLGYDETTCAASHASVDFFYHMLQGKSAIQAFKSLRRDQILDDCPNHKDGAHTANLKLVGNENLCIVHPQLATDEAIVDGGMVTFNGVVTGWNSFIDGDIGFVWGDMSIPTIEQGCKYNTVYSAGEQLGHEFTFTKREFDFQPNVTYYYRSYAKIGNEYIYGGIKSFVTEEANNIIYYTTTDNKPISLSSWVTTVKSNTYVDGIGIIVWNNDIVDINRPLIGYYPERLKSISLPRSVKTIYGGLFENCSSLEVINIPPLVTVLTNRMFMGCSSLKEVNIPEGVTSIGGSVFERCSSLESIRLPESLTDIGGGAFKDCVGLKEISIPASVINLGDNSFIGCTSLKSINLTYGLASIGKYAFDHCSSLSNIELPETLTTIGDYAFQYCSNLNDIKFPSCLTSMGKYAFRGCSALTSVDIPHSVTAMGEYTFKGCNNLSSVVIGDGLKAIPSYAFAYLENLRNVKLGANLTHIGTYAFAHCGNLKDIDFPESLLEIGDFAFYFCGFTTVTIPKNVIKLVGCTFSFCENLKSVYCRPTSPPEINGRNTFHRTSALKIYVPKASLDKYKSAKWWSDECVLPHIVGY